MPDIAWCWDGEEATAELIVDTRKTTGKPADVEFRGSMRLTKNIVRRFTPVWNLAVS